MATALACGYQLTQSELMNIALSIEPSDAVFYPGIVMMDHLRGSFVQELGDIPSAVITVFDQGGYIDTVMFNERTDLREIREKQSHVIGEALVKVKKGLAQHDLSLIGEGSTISAFANQEILYRSYLEDMEKIVSDTNSYGLVVAHSGTVCGVLSAPECEEEVKQKILERCGSVITYFDTVELYNNGITIKVRE